MQATHAHEPPEHAARRRAGPHRAAAPGDAGDAAPHPLLALQRQIGNTRVSRLLAQRDGAGDAAPSAAGRVVDAVGDLLDMRSDEERRDAEEELAEFMGRPYERRNFRPPTGHGLFDATYLPAAGDLTITLKLAFVFVSGDPAHAEGPRPEAGASFTPDQYEWQPGESELWKARAIADVAGAWSAKYQFHTTRPHWGRLPAVNVRVDVVEVPADEAHFVTVVRKWPAEPDLLDRVLLHPSSERGVTILEESGADGPGTPDVDTHSLPADAFPTYTEISTLNPGRIGFAHNESVVGADDKEALHNFGEALGRPDVPPIEITLFGRASSEGTEAHNYELSDDRARAVGDVLVGAGAKTTPGIVALGATGAAPTPEWRRVELQIEPVQVPQETVVHEAGHMLGNGDEYPTRHVKLNQDRPAGTRVAHSALAEAVIPGQEAVVAKNDDSIMSQGSKVRPHHYATFLEVLGVMTETRGTWAVGPGGPAAP